MSLRRILPVALAVLAACPSVNRVEPPEKIAFATFDATTSTIPLPNDLALQRAPGLPAGVQRELLGSFVAAGGFPADQEVPITIPITIRTKQSDGSYGAPAAPAGIDLATVDDAHVALYRVDVTPAQRLSRCATPVTATCWEPSYAVPANATSGQLSLRRNDPSGSRRWDAGGRYVAALRAGVLTSEGLPVAADGPIALIAPNKPLSVSENQPPGGLPPATAATVEGLRSVYATGRTWAPVSDAATCAAAGVPVTPCWIPVPSASAPAAFDVVKQAFPLAEIAAIQTFTAQPAGAVRPLTDTGSGQLPLPSDFLLDPATGKVRNVPAFGPAAAGLATLDGFSTTAPLLIPLSGPVQAATITRSTARIYKITGGGPVQLDDLVSNPAAPKIVTQPPTAVVNGAATSIVLAPAVPVPVNANLTLAIPPLDEKSQYLVVVTNGVRDAAGAPLKRSTLMDLVFTFTGALFDASKPAGSRSLVPGVADADAAGLQQLRTSLKPVLQALSLDSCANNAECAVLAYTVKTQSVKDVTKLLSAAPYGVEAAAAAAVFTPAAAADFDLAPLGVTFDATNFPNVAKFVQATIPTLYAIQGATGAFDPAFATWTPAQVQQHIKAIQALVAVPKLAAGCTSISPCPAPLVVFTHGINGARYQMIPLADALAARGFVVAAIDMPYHGDRALCAKSSDCSVAGGGDGVCTPDVSLQTPSDAAAPGTCTTGSLRLNPPRLSTVASGNFFVSSNFFRVRDGLRQNALDQSALVLALARPPSVAYPLQPSANPLAASLLAQGVVVDPTKVYFSGVSLGAIAGTSAVATNPRFSRATLTVAGGTIVDVFTTSPSYQGSLAPVFAQLGIDLACVQAGTGCDAATRASQSAKFAQALAIAKWIIDPAEPVNYAASFTAKTYDPALQPFVTGGLATATTQGYGQMVTNDQTVPNPTSRLLLTLTGVPFDTYTSQSRPTTAGGAVGLSLHELIYSDFPPGTPNPTTAGGILRDDLAAFLATGAATGGAKNVP